MIILSCYYCKQHFESDFSEDEIREAAEAEYGDDLEVTVRNICLDCYDAMQISKEVH